MILIFLAQLATVYLLGIQSLNVRDSNYVGAAVTSTALGICGHYVIHAIGRMPADAAFSLAWWGYVLAGPVGICLAIRTHPTVAQWLKTPRWLSIAIFNGAAKVGIRLRCPL